MSAVKRLAGRIRLGGADLPITGGRRAPAGDGLQGIEARGPDRFGSPQRALVYPTGAAFTSRAGKVICCSSRVGPKPPLSGCMGE